MSLTADVKNLFARRDNALYQLLFANVLVFVVAAGLPFLLQSSAAAELMLRQLALSANVPVLARHPWTVLTYAFTHRGFFHILFNMLNLYWFGQLVREYLGDRRLVSLYFLGALAGAVVFLLAYNFVPALQPRAAVGDYLIGASAAVTAIIVAAATLLPDYTLMVVLLGPVKIKWLAVAIVVFSVAGTNGGNAGGEIAHLGGALLGFVFVKQLRVGRDLGRPVVAVGNWLGRLFSRRPALQASRGGSYARPAVVRPAAKANGAGADEIDSILDKISRSGYARLSKEEKQKLFKASQQ